MAAGHCGMNRGTDRHEGRRVRLKTVAAVAGRHATSDVGGMPDPESSWVAETGLCHLRGETIFQINP